MNKQIDALVQKEMSRKEFLATVGFGLASVMGVGSVIKLLNGGNSPLAASNNKSIAGGHGYGSSAYGGNND